MTTGRTPILTGVLVLFIGFTGCSPGFIYTNVHEPLSDDMEATPAIGKRVEVYNRGFRVPLGARGSIGAQWKNGFIGESAKEAGLTKLYYADLHVISILGGLWQQTEVTVIGE